MRRFKSVVTHELEELRSIAALTGDLEAVAFQQTREALAEKDVIVRDDYARWTHGDAVPASRTPRFLAITEDHGLASPGEHAALGAHGPG